MPCKTPSKERKSAAARALRYRDRADYLRGMARRTDDVQVRNELQRIARECEARAARAPGEAAD